MAATDKLYFVGFMPEHFKGPGNTGKPTYASFDPNKRTPPDSIAIEQPNNVYNWPYTGIDMDANSILSGGLTDHDGTPLTDFTITFYAINKALTNNYNNGRAFLTLCDQSGTGNVQLINNNGVLTLTSVTSSTTLAQYYPTQSTRLDGYNMVASYIKIKVTVSGWGSTATVITATMYGNETGTVILGATSLTVDSSKQSAFSYFSLYPVCYQKSMPYTGGGTMACRYVYVSSFDTTRCTFDYLITGTQGTFKEWSGTVASWMYSPITYAVDSDGLYTSALGSTVTFTRQRAMLLPARHNTRIVMLQAAGYMGETGEEGTIQPVVYDPVSKLTRSFGENGTFTFEGNLTTWYSSMNPITNTPWIDSDESGYEYGIKRIA